MPTSARSDTVTSFFRIGLMRPFSRLLRSAALLSLLALAAPIVAADDIEVISDTAEYGTAIEEQTQAESENATGVDQQAGDDAVQAAVIENGAETQVDSAQGIDDHHEISIEQICAPGTTVCYATAAPHVVSDAQQMIAAASANLMQVLQQAGANSVQLAYASGSALTGVAAQQQVVNEAIIDIFQQCSIATGVCVQRALPEVITNASQIITASALNALEINQLSLSGALQLAAADLAAEVRVSAQQAVDAHALFRLSQICAVDVGLCVQRALPLMRTAVEQVVQAQADNAIDVLQDGAEFQDAAANTQSDTVIDTLQDVHSEMESETDQQCAVGKGLCIQVDGTGTPYYVFTDGETRTTGAYSGTLDETPLATDYSRESVGAVAAGICAGDQSCPMVQQLLLWLFGPPPAAPAPARAATARSSEDASNRGHQTNVLGASMKFLASMAAQGAVPPPAFGGDALPGITDDQRGMICAMQRMLNREPHSGDAWIWTTGQLSAQTGLAADAIAAVLHDPAACAVKVAVQEKVAPPSVFPVSTDGPVSSNPFWNACVRGETMTLEQIRANPDRNEDGLPRSCASYHTQDSWFHPDLRVHFRWDPDTGRLALPQGYIPQMQQS